MSSTTQNLTSPQKEPDWPDKTREILNHHLDSRVWNNFSFRGDDIIISAWAKSGTTWTQQIVSQLLTIGSDGKDVDLHMTSPWLDMRQVPDEPTLAALEAQTSRRFIKTHLPIDALVYSPKAKYIFVARDGRDTMWSMHNQYSKATDIFYGMINDGCVGPTLERPSNNPVEFFREFLDDDANMSRTHSPFWSHVRGWWNVRDLPNLLLLHFNDLKADKKKEIQRIANFLDITIPDDKWETIMDRTSFEYMKEHATEMSPPGAEILLENGAQNFINKGTNGRWIDQLSQDDVSRYEEKARSELGKEGANWLANGRNSTGL